MLKWWYNDVRNSIESLQQRVERVEEKAGLDQYSGLDIKARNRKMLRDVMSGMSCSMAGAPYGLPGGRTSTIVKDTAYAVLPGGDMLDPPIRTRTIRKIREAHGTAIISIINEDADVDRNEVTNGAE